MAHRTMMAAVRCAPSAIILGVVVVRPDNAVDARVRAADVLTQAVAAELNRSAFAAWDEQDPGTIAVFPARSSLTSAVVFSSI